MDIEPSVNTVIAKKYRLPLLTAFIAAGLTANYFKFQIFLNIDFLFGSVFAMLALQFLGRGRGIIAAAIIASYTYVLWNHPYAIIIMTAEVAAVGWLMVRRKMGMVLADTVFWLIIGMPLVYIFYHYVMHVPPTNAYITMTKQAVNGIANALVARLFFTGYALLTRSSQTSYRELICNLLAFFVLCPALVLLTIDSRYNFTETDRRIRTTMIQESHRINQFMETWVVNRKNTIISLAELAASRTTQQMEPSLKQAMMSDINLLYVGLQDREATITVVFPSLDEHRQKNIGKTFADYPYIPLLKQTLTPMLSEVVMGRFGSPKPIVLALAPVIINGAYGGSVFSILSLHQLQEYLGSGMDKSASHYSLIDKNGKVILTNRTDQTVMTPFVRGAGVFNNIYNGISQWIPTLPANTPASERWNKSFYVSESTVGTQAEWKLILEYPMGPAQKTLYKNYTDKLTLLFLILLGVLALAELLSRRIVGTLGQLGKLTHELPIRLATHCKEIVWPESGFSETHHLISNFRHMAYSLISQFSEVQQINQSLEHRTLELQEERQLLAGIISGTNVGTWEWNIQTGKTLFNERWAVIVGYTLEELSPTSVDTWMNLVHPDDYIICSNLLKKHFIGNLDYYDCEFRMKHKEGNWVWVLARGKVATFTIDGKPLLMLGTHQDITRRKQAEIYREMGREVLLILNMPYVLQDSIQRILSVLQSQTGFDAIGIRLQDGDDFPYFAQRGFNNNFLITENTLVVHATNCQLCQSKGSDSCLECTCGLVISGKGDPLLTVGGSFWTNDSLPLLDIPPGDDPRLNPRNQCILQGYASFALVPIRGENKIIGMIQLNDRRKGCFTSDTIELLEGIASQIGAALKRVQAETALRESNTRYDLLAEQSRTMAWEVDAMGLYTYISPLSRIVLGYSPEELVGKMYFYDLHPGLERESFKEAIFSIFERNDSFNNWEISLLNKKGQPIWFTSNGIPILNNDGILMGYRGSDTDITESKKIKEQLNQSQKMESVGQLAGGLAHDFNNLLSVINGYCCLINMDAEQEAEQNEYVERIQAASDRAAELTHSMLAFSRTQVINPKVQNLNETVSKIGMFVSKIIGDNIRFKTVIKEANIPVFIDDGQIEQVLINLANNARDAMSEGGNLEFCTDICTFDALVISAQGFGNPGMYGIITVSDTGAGMNESTIKKIFDPFFTTKAVDKGTGLGLAMVYGIVKQHNGFVDVTSTPGHGASFMVYLPIVETTTIDTVVKPDTVAEDYGGTETILIAEDNADLREFMRIVLSKLGYQIIIAVDGQDAVDKFRENADKIQLIIMDMIMPYKSGKVAYDEIKQIKPDTKALFSSGYSANIIQQQGELGEYAAFLPKPVQPAVLLKKVREMLEHRGIH
ncbi:MAG: PAS domain S-box protein [Chlorobium sp.]|nr:PAS domain S-box protein [Chlorobium sp.]